MFHKLLFKYVVANASYFVMHFTTLNFTRYLLKYVKSKFKKKNPIGNPYKKSVRYNVWENATPVFVLLLFSSHKFYALWGKSDSGQSGCADFEYDISILIKWHFPVAHDENSSYEKV